MIKDPNQFFSEGCGRCSKFQTPECKVHRWSAELAAFRTLALQSGLREEAKWGQPCYTLNGKNVCLIFAFNDRCGLSFFKGSALPDPDGLLEPTGPNGGVGRVATTTEVGWIAEHEEALRTLIAEAIAVEERGVKLEKPQHKEQVPEALEAELAADLRVREAWEKLTPGRRRSHLIHIDGAKQEATKKARAQRALSQILAGKGHNER